MLRAEFLAILFRMKESCREIKCSKKSCPFKLIKIIQFEKLFKTYEQTNRRRDHVILMFSTFRTTSLREIIRPEIENKSLRNAEMTEKG